VQANLEQTITRSNQERTERNKQPDHQTNSSSIGFLDIQVELQRRTAMSNSSSVSHAMILSADTGSRRSMMQPTVNINPSVAQQQHLSSLYQSALQMHTLRGEPYAPCILSRLPQGRNRDMDNAASSFLPYMEAPSLAPTLEEVRRMEELYTAATLSGPHLYADLTSSRQSFLQSALVPGIPQSTSFSESMSPQDRLYTETVLGLSLSSNEDAATQSMSAFRFSNLPTVQQREYQSTNLPVPRPEIDRLLEQYWLQEQARKRNR
jgi:hypothetical protein